MVILLTDSLQPFTNDFPRADIYELITPDLLHQLIKGTFKDHVLEWIIEYIYAVAENEAAAEKIIDDIDRRLVFLNNYRCLLTSWQARRCSVVSGSTPLPTRATLQAMDWK
jgi:hypothetical protein